MFTSRSFILTLLGAPLLALAQNANPFKIPTNFSATAGQPLSLNWNPTTSGTVTLVLRSGASSDLAAGTVIASSIANSGSYSWTPDTMITRGSDYTVEIVSDSDPTQTNYTPYFVLDSTNTVAYSTSQVSLGAATASSALASSALSTASATGSATSVAAAISSASASASSASASASSAASASASSASGSGTTAAAAATTSGASSAASGSQTSSGMATSTAAASGTSAAAATSAKPETASTAGAARATAMAGVLGLAALGVFAL